MHDVSLPGRGAAIAATIGLVAMLAALVYGLQGGYLMAEGWAIASITWGQVLLADLYTGFLLFGAWMAWRERSVARAAAWVIALLVLGNIAACVYVLVALRQSGGDAQRFWNGPVPAGETAA